MNYFTVFHPIQISKVEIDIPETKFEDPSKIPDYPPRISITCTTTARSLTLSVEGVKNECTFTIIIPPASMYNYNLYNTYVQTTKKCISELCCDHC